MFLLLLRPFSNYYLKNRDEKMKNKKSFGYILVMLFVAHCSRRGGSADNEAVFDLLISWKGNIKINSDFSIHKTLSISWRDRLKLVYCTHSSHFLRLVMFCNGTIRAVMEDTPRCKKIPDDSPLASRGHAREPLYCLLLKGPQLNTSGGAPWLLCHWILIWENRVYAGIIEA